MVDDAENRKTEIAHLNMHNGDDPRMFKMPDDPRVTRRRPIPPAMARSTSSRSCSTSCRGSMSLVGPRPLILDEDQYVASWARRRLDLKPGITGLWQVLGRERHPVRRDDEARLPLRHELVAPRRPALDPAHPAVADAGARCVLIPALRKPFAAAGVGFEPTGRLHAHRFSRPTRSAAPAPRRRAL